MPYTTTELITRAWYLSGIVAKGLQTVTGEQLNDGLNMLNALLSFKTANQRLIPYYTKLDFNGVIGQETYFIENLILVETLTFVIDSVRYPMMPVLRKEFFGTGRANDVNSLPYEYYVERTLGGANLSMYFKPQQDYVFTMHAKFALDDVVLGQDLLLTMDQYYIEYLRYALSEYMCQEYKISLDPSTTRQLMEFEKTLVDVSPLDLTMSKLSTLQRRQGPDVYAQVNIARGYVPG